MPQNSAKTSSFRARWVHPVSTPPIANGVVTVQGGRIVAVGTTILGDEIVELGDTAILPGLINAHTHLEFSYLYEPLGVRRMAFPAWIREVVSHRRARAVAGVDFEASRVAAVQQGLAESKSHGVTTIGDIASPGVVSSTYEHADISTVVFLELLGMAAERESQLREIAETHLRTGTEQAEWIAGLSPHSPYTASPDLVVQACALSKKHQATIAMHLAESHDELELLASHSGRFVELLQDLDAWHPGAIPRGIQPLDYLEMLSRAHRALVIHGNFLTTSEIRFLADHNDRMSVVYCPRTHDFFLSEKYPLREMLAAGVRAAVGTDSRASNPDLSVLNELKFIAHRFPEIVPATILELGTINAAGALGLEADRGSLDVGKRADFTFVPLSSGEAANPYSFLYAESSN